METVLPVLFGIALFCQIQAAEQSIFEAREGEFHRIVSKSAKLEKLGEGLKFTEGPVWIEKDGGYVVFSDIPANELKRWSLKDGVTTFRQPSNNANGNTVDLQGRLVTAEHAARRVSITQEDGTVLPLVEHFNGKKFNSPNDVVVKSDGTVWFTDPSYGTPKDQQKELEGDWVFRYDPSTKQLTVVVKDFDKPNGLCFSPDEKKLYIADSGKPHHIRSFEVEKNGTVSHDQVFCVIDKGGPDGIRCDAKGRIFSSAGDGVHIFSPEGKLLGKILVPESPANLCFGGPKFSTLFITARTGLYKIELNTQGNRHQK
jgi:gluconolactonase